MFTLRLNLFPVVRLQPSYPVVVFKFASLRHCEAKPRDAHQDA